MELFIGAIVFALLFTLVVTAGYQGERNYRNLFWSFLFLLLPLWALAVWIPQFGPIYMGVAWLQMIILAFTIVVFVLALTPSEYLSDRQTHKVVTTMANSFFWLFAVIALVGIYLGYMMMEKGMAH